eukprot:5132294-Pyramimonas_sp.AAC.1
MRTELDDLNKKFVIHSDNENILKSPDVREYMVKNGGRPHRSAPGKHNTNALAESAVKLVGRGLRSVLLHSHVLPKYWHHAVRA